MKCLTFFFLLIPVFLNGKQWSRQNLYKYGIRESESSAAILDGSGYQWERDGIFFSKNGWFRTGNIPVGNGFVFDKVFVNVDGRIKLAVRDSQSEKVLFEGNFEKDSSRKMGRVLSGNVYLQILSVGSPARLYSFGLKRIPMEIIRDQDLVLSCSNLFFGEGFLGILFKTHYPAKVDILIFDQNGEAVDTLVENRVYLEGTHEVLWNPVKSSTSTLTSGHYVVYLLARSENGFKQEASKFFYFIRS